MMMMYYIRVGLRFHGLEAVAGTALNSRCTSECAQGVRFMLEISILDTGAANSVRASCGCQLIPTAGTYRRLSDVNT